MPTIYSERGESRPDFPIVLRVEVPTIRPTVTKAGDMLVIHADCVHIVRPASNDRDAWLAHWMQGVISPASVDDTARMYALQRVALNDLKNPQDVVIPTANYAPLRLEVAATDLRPARRRSARTAKAGGSATSSDSRAGAQDRAQRTTGIPPSSRV